ncbi:uncharacterized protein PAC_01510 [Phialocephala subalpina]|uniref:Uncharacterized protein n=1 Tax=Phialocephala subalpina TaxID=576137 RepID=A0A1L7WFT5_9HELO|nr:uncharacterized protein PAC_01510 [Phialocephala subalpina]
MAPTKPETTNASKKLHQEPLLLLLQHQAESGKIWEAYEYNNGVSKSKSKAEAEKKDVPRSSTPQLALIVVFPAPLPPFLLFWAMETLRVLEFLDDKISHAPLLPDQVLPPFNLDMNVPHASYFHGNPRLAEQWIAGKLRKDDSNLDVGKLLRNIYEVLPFYG